MKKFLNIGASILFLLWFLGSIGIMLLAERIFLPEYKTSVILIVFGQYFLVFGIVGIVSFIKAKSKLKNLPLLIFALVGLSLIATGVIMVLTTKGILDGSIIELLGKFFPLIILNFFLLIGIVFIAVAFYNSVIYKGKCTYEISATCVEEKALFLGDQEYSPVYEIYINGQTQTITSDTYTRIRHKVNEKYIIKVNPDNPEMFVDDTSGRTNMIYFILGMIFVVVTVFSDIMMFSDGGIYGNL